MLISFQNLPKLTKIFQILSSVTQKLIIYKIRLTFFSIFYIFSSMSTEKTKPEIQYPLFRPGEGVFFISQRMMSISFGHIETVIYFNSGGYKFSIKDKGGLFSEKEFFSTFDKAFDALNVLNNNNLQTIIE